MMNPVFRFALSSHPRSGLMSCLSFTIVSLSAHRAKGGEGGPKEIAWSRGIALVTGVVAAVLVNWVVWPFVARHELRKSLSHMLLNLGIAYRAVVARFVVIACMVDFSYEILDTSITTRAMIRRPKILKYRRSRRLNFANTASG